jgi:hypothetical protein
MAAMATTQKKIQKIFGILPNNLLLHVGHTETPTHLSRGIRQLRLKLLEFKRRGDSPVAELELKPLADT